MTEALTRRLIEAVASRLMAAADSLTELDRQTGDGDHGANMKLGCEAVLAQIEQLAQRPLPDALRAVGSILQMKVGGASGPLYGTLFVTLGKGLAQDPAQVPVQGPVRLAAALEGAITAMQRLGRSGPGCKTMLDVLVPVQHLLMEGGADLPARIDARAVEAAEATASLQATRGRAAFLGDRSIGHVDPGARSAQLMVAAVCSVLRDA
jgi:phosphoenolpyruvate---glycerone phosphotransferase subunit DhaL